jgi:adenylyltransferase/sulfurtransferase
MKLTTQERERYARHLLLAGFGMAAQERLKAGRVLVIGAGGLGCPALLYLAAAGAGRITVIDPDRVDVSNLQRQVLYTTADVGEPKAEAAARRLRALNELVEIVPIAGRFSRENALGLVGDCDVVVDGSDNFATRYLVNDACVIAGRPFVYGAIQGFTGQLSVFNWRGGPTYRCLFPEPPEPGEAPPCSEAGVLGVLPGLIGTAQAAEALKVLAGVGEPASGRLLLWDALTAQVRTVAVAPDPRRRVIRELPEETPAACCGVSAACDEEISAEELRAWLAGARPPLLLDVREPAECAGGMIGGAVNVPLGRLERDGAAALPEAFATGAPAVAYCAAGARSLRAVRLLRGQHGFRGIRSLQHGLRGW